MAALFGMTGIMFVHKLPDNRKLLWVALCAPGSVAVGVIMTALRIIGSIPIVGYSRFSTLHAGIGISFYLAGMILCYLAAENILRRMGRVIADG
jgi:exosortase K